MPLRDYICKECGHEFEEFLGSFEDPEGCRHCESSNIERLPSAPGGYHIKGTNAGSTRPKNAGSFKKSLKVLITVLVTGFVFNPIAEAKTPKKISRSTIISAISDSVTEVNAAVMKEVRGHGRIHGLVPLRLLLAICTVESSLNPKAIHFHDGDGTSYGLCQIKEATAREMGFDANTQLLMNHTVNSFYAAKYLSHQMERYEDDWIRAIGAYNSGSSHRHISNQEYVNKVLAEATKL